MPTQLKKIARYGYYFAEGTPMWLVHAWCYRYKTDIKERRFHFIEGVNELWGPNNPTTQFIWHPWAYDMLDECLNNQYVAFVGSGSSGKSVFMAVWMLFNFYSDPFNTLCACTTTSIGDGKKRIWGSVTEYHNAVANAETGISSFSKLVTHPTPQIYAINQKGKQLEKNGIMMVASERGGKSQKSGKMRGYKVGEMPAKNGVRRGRFFLCMDEMTDIEAIVLKTAMSNLTKNPFFHAIGAANPSSFHDAFGQFVKPDGVMKIDGEEVEFNSYAQIDDSFYRWPIQQGKGVALHFDEIKHPNFIARKNLYPFLNTWEKIQDAIDTQDPNSLEFWRDVRGFWPPVGVVNTIYSEADLIAYNAYSKKVEWQNKDFVVKYMGVDPAFTNGGDRTAVSIISVGKNILNQWQVHIERIKSIYPDASVKDKLVDEAVARDVWELALLENIPSSNIAIDTTGGGSAWGTVFSMVSGKTDWIQVNFGGAASELPISTTDSTKSKDKYVNRVTEIWFSAKELLRQKCLTGVTNELAFEMTNRKYTTTRSGGVGTKVLAEKKEDMRKRMQGKSPDLADATFVAFDGMRQTLKFRMGKELGRGQNSAFRQRVDRLNVTLKSRQKQGYYAPEYN